MADSTARFSNWFQIVSNVAIIVGLGLVIYELNQSKQIAHVQMMDEGFGRMTSRRLALLGDDPRPTLARAALHPEQLTEEDAVLLEEIYSDVTTHWSNALASEQLTGVDRKAEIMIAGDLRRYFTTEPGRRWLQAWASKLTDSLFGDRLERLLKKALREDAANYYASIYHVILAKN